MIRTIEFKFVATGSVTGVWVLADGEISADGEFSESILNAARGRGMPDEEIWAFYRSWSNGYYQSLELPSDNEA